MPKIPYFKYGLCMEMSANILLRDCEEEAVYFWGEVIAHRMCTGRDGWTSSSLGHQAHCGPPRNAMQMILI